MTTQNIHILIAKIRVQQVKAYLADRGWSEQTSGGRLSFERADSTGDGPTQIFMAADPMHAKFRSYLQNLLFSLSVIEQREPYDIAFEMTEIHTPAPSTVPDTARLATENEELTNWVHLQFPSMDRGQVLRLVKRFHFSCGDVAAARAQPDGYLRAAATLICGLIGSLGDSNESRKKLFELANRLLSRIQWTIPMDGDDALVDEAWSIARDDDSELPLEFFSFLLGRARAM